MSVHISFAREIPNLGMNQSASLVKKAVQWVLEEEQITEDCALSVLFTDDEGIRRINREFREIDRATDVLSFPMNELIPEHFDASLCERDPETGEILLGDMVISIPRCVVQGEEFGHGYDRELCYLTVHSILHLLGYDHVDEGPMKKQMRSKEKKIMGDT